MSQLSCTLLCSFVFLAGCGGAERPASSPTDTTGTATEGEPTASVDAGEPAAAEAQATPASGESSEGAAAGDGVPTKRSMESIVQVIKNNRHLFRLCYEKVQKTKTDLRGDVVIAFRINAAGAVIDAQVNPEGTTLLDEAVGSCAANEMKKLTFPEAESGMDTEINYPFNFNPK